MTNLDLEKARQALDSMDHYARMAGITPSGALRVLTNFINKVEDEMKKEKK